MTFWERIDTNKLKLSALDFEILNYIIENKKCVIKENLSFIANKNNVSVSMINKVLKKVDIQGFKELKLTLMKELILEEITYDNLKGDYTYEQSIYIKTFIDTTNNIDKKKIHSLVDSLTSTEQNLIWGEGFNKYIAKDFQRKLNKINIDFRTLEDLENIKYVNTEKNTTLIILSVSGTTEDIGKLIEFIKARLSRIKIFAITSSEQFNWKKEIDEQIYGKYFSLIDRHEKEVPTTSRIVLTYILDIIFRQVFFHDREENIKKLKRAALIL